VLRLSLGTGAMGVNAKASRGEPGVLTPRMR